MAYVGTRDLQMRSVGGEWANQIILIWIEEICAVLEGIGVGRRFEWSVHSRAKTYATP
jgi:hypothetical protein